MDENNQINSVKMTNMLQITGLGCVVFCFFYLIKIIFDTFYIYAVGPVINKVDFKLHGKWALVTGATDGIGKEYAKQLASRGLDIVLVSRSSEKLQETAQEIEKKYKVATKTIQVDFTGGDEIYETIEKEIAGLEIGTLVNNVGVSYKYPEYFLDIPDADTLITSLIKANVVSVTRVSKLVMPGMLARNKGVVINIGSASSMIPSPLLTVYAATKAYVDKFTEGLQIEYTKQGIIIQSVMPGFVCSKMSGIRRSTVFAPTAEEFVKSAISLVGVVDRTTGYLPHGFFIHFIRFLQGLSFTFTNWLVTRSMENSRRKHLRKNKAQ